MRHLLIALAFLASSDLVVAKPALPQGEPEDWPTLDYSEMHLSNDGRYLSYSISTVKAGIDLVIQGTQTQWKKDISGANEALFTEDSRRAIYKRSDDSLEILDLEDHSIREIPAVERYKIPQGGDGRWLAYRRKSDMVDWWFWT